jgi:hypothetical protein
MKKFSLLLLVLLSLNAFSQEHWEDNFWRKQTQEKYKKTFSMAGLYTEFYDNGQIKWQGKCLENGTPDSTWVYYDRNGYKIWEGAYNGTYTEYKQVYDQDYTDEPDEAGNTFPQKVKIKQDTILSGHYLNGLKEGEWTEYDYTGTYIIKTGHYHAGEPTGIWQTFTTEPVVTKHRKMSEYNYSTQNTVYYGKNDSIIRTEHKDSLEYGLNNGFIQRRRFINSGADPVSFNFCAAGTVQWTSLDRLNNFFYQPGYSRLEGPLQSYGFEWSGVSERLYWSYDIKWTPAISAQLNDSIRLRLSGWNTALYFGGDLIQSDHVDLCPAGGIGFQQLKLKTLKLINADTSAYSFREGDYRVYMRSAVTASVELNLRINMGNASLAFTGGYLFDCTSQRWRYNGRYLDESPRTSLSGPFATVSFGIHIPDY